MNKLEEKEILLSNSSDLSQTEIFEEWEKYRFEVEDGGHEVLEVLIARQFDIHTKKRGSDD
jgi:hypothetical protein